MIPPKLKRGDHIRVIAPSGSLATISPEVRQIAVGRLNDLGFSVSFSKNAEERDFFDSSPIQSRLDDLHEAFSNPEVNGIFSCIGGNNSNQLLSYIDYALIAKSPKVFCGYSDITALSNSIYAMTGLVTYSGPHFSSFGMLKGIDYTLEYLKACLMDDTSFEIRPPPVWSDDAWYWDQENREFIHHEGFMTLNEGQVHGRIIGGNLCTLNLLHGTEFMPDISDSILFIEDDHLIDPSTFDRDLQSLIHQPHFNRVKGLIIGRFQKGSRMTDNKLSAIIDSKIELKDLPVIANASFGHTYPQITFPIGGTASLKAYFSSVILKINEH